MKSHISIDRKIKEAIDLHHQRGERQLPTLSLICNKRHKILLLYRENFQCTKTLIFYPRVQITSGLLSNIAYHHQAKRIHVNPPGFCGSPPHFQEFSSKIPHWHFLPPGTVIPPDFTITSQREIALDQVVFHTFSPPGERQWPLIKVIKHRSL